MGNSSLMQTKHIVCIIVCLGSVGFMYHWRNTGYNTTRFQSTEITHNSFENKGFIDSVPQLTKPLHLDTTNNRTGRSKRDGAWVGSSNPIEIYAYSAFYDDRASLMSLPIVRVIVVTEAPDKTALQCLIQYKNKSDVVVAKRLRIGFGVLRHGKKLREYVVSCQLRNTEIPTHVAVTTTMTSRSTWSLPVELPEKPSSKRDFAVCVSVCYGKEWDVYKLVEWMELLKTLGVSRVGIYNNTLGSEAARVFQYYDSQGFVEFRQSWNFLSDQGVLTSHLHWSPVINDCIYRNLYSFTKILVIDVDEVIVPKTAKNLSQLLIDIDKHQLGNIHPARSYTFRNNYFFYDIRRKDCTMPKYIKMLTHRCRLPPSRQGYSAKSIISPLACTHMHNHYCWGYTKHYSGEGHHVEVDPRFGVSQHYKKCHFSRGECERLFINITQDDTMLRYKDKLIPSVDLALKELNIVPSISGQNVGRHNFVTMEDPQLALKYRPSGCHPSFFTTIILKKRILKFLK